MLDSYEGLLNVATEAALEAGKLLREEFLKPGGPSGQHGHAEVDQRAEEIIRRRLMAASPDWGYRGEETAPGGIAGADRHHVWLVDPNDGTGAYLKGFRGSAVSVALLRDGTPVLGVIYAFVAPDNQGDLFVWAEELDRVRRNGVPVDRLPWATALARETTIMVSQSADRAVDANLVCVSPARFLAVPSIAYRLALVAAGEGEVGVSLNGPGDWDYAAGHALLRGAGGALIDQNGSPVAYAPDGSSSTSACYGGAPGLVGEIARRPWSGVFTHSSETPEPFGLCWPVLGQTLGDASLLQRVQGCMLGQLAGDALGSMVEFQGAAAISARYSRGVRKIGPSTVFSTLAGQPTDDSEMALVLARTLVRDGAFDENAIAGAYGYWRKSEPFDVGGTIGAATLGVLAAHGAGKSQAAAARAAANTTSEANGALMRQSPLAIWGHALDPMTLTAYVRADTTLTHPNQVCQDASAAFIVALAAVIHEGLDGPAAYARAKEWNHRHGASPTVTGALEAATDGPPDYEHQEGHVLIALQNAFYQALYASSLEAGVVATVMGGGDTDTNAAIAGALLGAIHGARAIPSQWRQAVLTCRPHTGASAQQPRPQAFWPVDALILAERLATTKHDEAPDAAHRTLAHDGDSGLPSWVEEHRAIQHITRVTPEQPARASHLMAQIPERGRFIGALLGGAMGDALGRPCEGMHPQRIHERYGRLTGYHKWSGWTDGPIGTITDDTLMTMCVAECLTANGFLDPEDLARRFVAWLPIGRGKGKSTTAAVTRLREGVPWYLSGEDSAGNGAAMRSAPVGLVYWNNAFQRRTAATLTALPTHRQPMAVAGAVAMAAATAWLLTRRPGVWSSDEFIAAVQAAIVGLEPGPLPERRNPSSFTTLYDRLGEIPTLLVREPDDAFAQLYNGAYVLESVPAALYCFLRSPDDVEKTLLLAVHAGHDADTVAAMAGTLGGALGGVEVLPPRLLPELEYRDELIALANRLYGLSIYDDSTRLSEDMEGGFGRMIPNSELNRRNIPTSDADWTDILSFALTFDGYWYWGSPEKCRTIASPWLDRFKTMGALPPPLTDLRTCLFMMQRSFHWDDDWPPHSDEEAFVRALISAIWEKVQANQSFAMKSRDNLHT